MVPKLGVSLWCLWMILFCSGQLPAETSAQTRRVEAEVQKWVKSWNTYDLNSLEELYLQSNRLTYFSSEKEGLIRGIEQVREHLKGFGFIRGGKTTKNILSLKSLRIDLFGPCAVATGIWHFFNHTRQTRQKGPVTIVYTLKGTEYRIVHMNFSNYK